MIDNPDYTRIVAKALSSYMLTPEVRSRLRHEYRYAETLDDLSEGARVIYEWTKNALDHAEELERIAESHGWPYWVTPELEVITSKAELEEWLRVRGMSMKTFKESLFYTMNREIWDAMRV